MIDTTARVRKLLRGDGVTAAQVAAALGVSKPTAYKYIKALKKVIGAAVMTRRERISAHGPKSKVYYMTTDRRTK